MAKLGSESIGAGRLENVTIRTIGGMLDIGLREAGVQIGRTQAVMANSVSAAKSAAWTDEDCDHATKNIEAIRQAFNTVLDGAVAVAKQAKDMQVQKSEMDGVAFGGPGAD